MSKLKSHFNKLISGMENCFRNKSEYQLFYRYLTTESLSHKSRGLEVLENQYCVSQVAWMSWQCVVTKMIKIQTCPWLKAVCCLAIFNQSKLFPCEYHGPERSMLWPGAGSGAWSKTHFRGEHNRIDNLTNKRRLRDVVEHGAVFINWRVSSRGLRNRGNRCGRYMGRNVCGIVSWYTCKDYFHWNPWSEYHQIGGIYHI